MNQLNFEGLANFLLGRALQILPSWVPGGRMYGAEYCAATISGGQGDSFKVNTKTGKWADFASDEKGGDLISLYAAIHRLEQGEAAKRLSEAHGFPLTNETKLQKQEKPSLILSKPPKNAPTLTRMHPVLGRPSYSWEYTDADGQCLFYISRYDTPTGKQFCPWSWDSSGKRWVAKGWNAPRPLYNLRELNLRKESPVLIVEGEKAADAAKKLMGNIYVPVTWPNGSKAASKADWAPVHGRKILIWPDADEPGIKAAHEIAELLKQHCQEIKIINVDGQPKGWDAADALEEKWEWERLKEWAKPRAQTFNVTINETTIVNDGHVDLPENQDKNDLWASIGVATTEKGAAICNVDAALRLFQGWDEIKNILWYDEFHKRLFTKWKSDKVREWQDVDTLNLTAHVQRELGITRMNDDLIFKAAMIYAHKNSRNEPRDWMDSLEWDGKERIPMFFIECFGVKKTDYSLAVGNNFWVGMAARIYRPGCQLDNMVVLEGSQGIGKTRALRAIGGPWYTEAHESVTSKDFFLSLHGRLLVELAELDSFSKAEVTRIKQVVTCTTDRFRAPYARGAQDYPRMSIFVGSTNESHYLRDNTGARRFWPLRCGSIDHDLIVNTRDQLFAEAVAKFKSGEAWHLMPSESTKAEQEDRRQIDAWESVIQEFLYGKQEVHIKDLAAHMKFDMSRFDIMHQRRMGAILRKLGWSTKKVRRGWETVRLWCAEDHEPYEQEDSLEPVSSQAQLDNNPELFD